VRERERGGGALAGHVGRKLSWAAGWRKKRTKEERAAAGKRKRKKEKKKRWAGPRVEVRWVCFFSFVSFIFQIHFKSF
jgi:hypothetical protein